MFVVNEHAKVQVKEITSSATRTSIATSSLEVMQTKEGGFLSFLTSAGTYREDAFQRDLQAIQFVYGDKGYIYAKLAKPAVAL